MSILGFLDLAETSSISSPSTCLCFFPLLFLSGTLSQFLVPYFLSSLFPLSRKTSDGSFYAYKMFPVITLKTADGFPSFNPCGSLTPQLWHQCTFSLPPAIHGKNVGCFSSGCLGWGQTLKRLESCPPRPLWVQETCPLCSSCGLRAFPTPLISTSLKFMMNSLSVLPEVAGKETG